eukprot:69501_1
MTCHRLTFMIVSDWPKIFRVEARTPLYSVTVRKLAIISTYLKDGRRSVNSLSLCLSNVSYYNGRSTLNKRFTKGWDDNRCAHLGLHDTVTFKSSETGDKLTQCRYVYCLEFKIDLRILNLRTELESICQTSVESNERSDRLERDLADALERCEKSESDRAAVDEQHASDMKCSAEGFLKKESDLQK